MMVAPEPEQAVQLMCSHGHRDVSAPSNLRKFCSCVQAMATVDLYEVLLCGADDTILFDRIPRLYRSR